MTDFLKALCIQILLNILMDLVIYLPSLCMDTVRGLLICQMMIIEHFNDYKSMLIFCFSYRTYSSKPCPIQEANVS